MPDKILTTPMRRVSYRPVEYNDNTSIVNNNVQVARQTVQATKEVNKDYERLKKLYPRQASASYSTLKKLEQADIKRAQNTPVINVDTRVFQPTQEQIVDNVKAEQERENALHNLELADRVVEPWIKWTPAGGLYEAGATDVMRLYGDQDQARMRGLGAALRIPFDIAGGGFAATRPLMFATSTLGAVGGDYLADNLNANPVDRLLLTLGGGVVGGASPSMFNNFTSRFTPQGFRIGNYAYKPDRNTLSSGFPVISSSYVIQDLPGMQIKSLIKGSPLERQLSKNGTISVKQLQAYIGRNDVPNHDKYLIQQVLNNHQGETHLDYNTLRKEVQGTIPVYNRVPQTKHNDYGIDALGFKSQTWADGEAIRLNPETLQFEYYPNEKGIPNVPNLNTFTFESPGLKGNAAHYDPTTLGHSRTYTTLEEPNVLHVMESQSDWAQRGGVTNALKKRSLELAKKNIEESLVSGNYVFSPREELETRLANIIEKLKAFELDPVRQRMVTNYTNRQIQENLRYASENGQTKMRYPTPETAAKIEGYTPIKQKSLQYIQLEEKYNQIEDAINKMHNDKAKELFIRDNPNSNNFNDIDIEYYDEALERLLHDKKYKKLSSELNNLEGELHNLYTNLENSKIYKPEHQTILKKYSNFPKQYEKLFGKGTVRQVTDGKGNTWYEVNVPQSYLDGTAEMIFKKGGHLVPKIHIKKENKGKFTESAKQHGMGVQQFASHVLANKDKYSPKLVKRANFARNSKKWKHE